MKVGVVGVGWAGQQHIEAYAALDGVSLIGIAGLEEETREGLAAKFGVPHSVARWEDLLELDGLEAISVAVPTFLHAPIAIAALERGIHVLSEKPIALGGEQAAAMVAAARDAGRVLQVAFNHRRRGDVKRLRALIEDFVKKNTPTDAEIKARYGSSSSKTAAARNCICITFSSRTKRRRRI